MEVKLLRANIADAKEIHTMQVEAFRELLEKYQDFELNPGNESVEKIEARLQQSFTFFYFICIGQQKVGAIRIVDKKEAGKSKEFPHYLYCRNLGGMVLHKKQSGYVKKYTETRTGNLAQFCKNLRIVIYMKKWDIKKQAQQK